jgi:hypothetical protein
MAGAEPDRLRPPLPVPDGRMGRSLWLLERCRIRDNCRALRYILVAQCTACSDRFRHSQSGLTLADLLSATVTPAAFNARIPLPGKGPGPSTIIPDNTAPRLACLSGRLLELRTRTRARSLTHLMTYESRTRYHRSSNRSSTHLLSHETHPGGFVVSAGTGGRTLGRRAVEGAARRQRTMSQRRCE